MLRFVRSTLIVQKEVGFVISKQIIPKTKSHVRLSNKLAQPREAVSFEQTWKGETLRKTFSSSLTAGHCMLNM